MNLEFKYSVCVCERERERERDRERQRETERKRQSLMGRLCIYRLQSREWFNSGPIDSDGVD